MNTLAATPAASAHPLTRDEWVELQLTDTFVRYSRPALHAGLVLTMVMIAILYRQVALLPLGLWTLAVCVVTALRFAAFTSYARGLFETDTQALRRFVARCTWAWSLSGLAWGSSMFVFFTKASIHDQFLCLVLLVGMAGFAIGTFSSCLKCFTGFVNGLGASVVLALVWALVETRVEPVGFNLYGMAALVLIYWAVVLVAGQRFHRVHRDNLELQFDNAQLISSLTEQSRAAMEAVAIKNRFIASAAHDLRQPVHALDLYAGWLAAEPEFVAQIAPKIVRSTKAVADLFDSLFDLAGLESDPLRVNLQETDLAGVLRDLELQYTPFAQERGLRLRMRTRPAVVMTDPVLLKRLVGNLLSNALKNTRQGGVLLALRRKREVWCIEIWDTGVGIAHEHQKAIFQEFYRIPMQGTEEGFGLGLAIVSRLSQAMGHPVRMASKVGRGSVFRVELPAVGPARIDRADA